MRTPKKTFNDYIKRGRTIHEIMCIAKAREDHGLLDICNQHIRVDGKVYEKGGK